MEILHKFLLHPFFLALILFIFLYKQLFNKPAIIRNLPPSPPKLPILGNFHQLGKFPHRSLHILSKQYGEITSIKIGSIPAIVVSSSKVACEVMKTHDVVFSGRARSRVTCKIFYDGKDIVFNSYGDFWKQMKNISVVHLLSNKKIQSFCGVREEEVSLVIDLIKRSIPSPFNLSEFLLMITENVLCRTVFGRKYAGENGINGELLAEFVRVMGVFSMGDLVPWLGWVDRVSGFERQVDVVAKTLDTFLERVVQEHMYRSKADEKDDNKDFVNILLDVQKENPDALPKDSIKAILLDMFAAGTETTSILVEWAMTELLGHPKVMKELQDEVRGAVRPKEMVNEDDVQKLHYLKAVIKETLRLHPPLPLLVIRESSKDVKVHGYDIAANTTVIINAWAINRDPSYWVDPDKFQPNRFLNLTERVMDFNWISFGGGRRGCPGMSFALAVAELALANLVYTFDWRLPDGVACDASNIPEQPGAVIKRRDPLMAIVNMPFED